MFVRFLHLPKACYANTKQDGGRTCPAQRVEFAEVIKKTVAKTVATNVAPEML